MQRIINRFGEIEIKENIGILKMPYSHLEKEANLNNLVQSYISAINDFGLDNDLVIYSNDLTDDDNYFVMKFDLKNKRPFIDVRAFDFRQQLQIFLSIVELGRVNKNILWEKENFLLDFNTGKIQALLFEFDGFPLHYSKSAFEGVKSLLFLALTNLEKIDRKPNRSDFIDQSTKIIDFANVILNTSDLDELSSVIINTIEIETENQNEETENDANEKNSRKKLQFFKKKKPVETDLDFKEQLKRNLASKTISDEEEKPFTQKIADLILTPKGIVVLVLVFGVMLMLAYVVPSHLGGDADEEKELKINQQKTMEAYRTYIMGNKEKAYSDLDTIGYKNLREQDRKVLLKFYLDQGKYTKALEYDPDYAYTIGDKMIKEGNRSDLEKLAIASDNDILLFDLASLNKEYQTVINRAGKIGKISERRANEIVKAFFLTNQDKELEDFISALEKNENNENNVLALRTVQHEVYPIYQFYQEESDNYNSALKKKSNQSKIDELKQKRDERYKEIENNYTTVNYNTNS
ncbi:hypothetical protein [Bacillus safensis]|uniref:Uncharacterized protein n=1 Tax=Bacillus safensis TaxID=561879 RepID=A0A1L6ZPB2_BACIA|nr:hypothetical protein [Bacillus safensis]APT48364.1 hypothetical protein BSA145_21100 [Bacillus safensis]